MMSARVKARFAVMSRILHANPSHGRDAVGARKELDRVMGIEGSVALLALDPLHPLENMHAGERTFRGDEGGRVLDRLFRHRLADLERHLEIPFLDAPRATVAGTALDHRNVRGRKKPQ